MRLSGAHRSPERKLEILCLAMGLKEKAQFQAWVAEVTSQAALAGAKGEVAMAATTGGVLTGKVLLTGALGVAVVGGGFAVWKSQQTSDPSRVAEADSVAAPEAVEIVRSSRAGAGPQAGPQAALVAEYASATSD